MPRYRYACPTCELTDVKTVAYRIDHDLVSTGERVAVCPHCDGPLERVWLKPPRSWLYNLNKQD